MIILQILFILNHQIAVIICLIIIVCGSFIMLIKPSLNKELFKLKKNVYQYYKKDQIDDIFLLFDRCAFLILFLSSLFALGIILFLSIS